MTIGRSRFAFIAVVFIVAMLTFSLTRTILMMLSHQQADLSIGSLMEIYSIGAVYDMAFFIYALVPASIYLLFLPNRIWRSRPNKILIHLACFSTIYGLLFIVVAEVLFWQEFQTRFNFISVDYLIYRQEVVDNITQSYPVAWFLAVIFLLAAFIYRWLLPSIRRALNCEETFRCRVLISSVLFLLPVSAYATLDQRLMNFSGNVYQNELAGDGPYQFVAAFRNNELDYNRFYVSLDENRASRILRKELQETNSQFDDDTTFSIRRVITAQGKEQHFNIMLVMIESLDAEYLAEFGSDKGLTPNLDKLAKQSLLFGQFYATGNRTTRGLEAVTLSIPPTPGRSIVKRLGHESGFWSLGNVLKSKGYDTRFVYGGRGYFDNMNAFFTGNGYTVVDQSNVPEEDIGFKNAWGMADEYLYHQVIKLADTAYSQGQPFFFHLLTTSNHRPYTFPDGRIDLPSGKGGRYGAVKYTDWAIGDFLAQAQQKPWFNDTLFVFVADHTADSAGKTALPLYRYHIPLLIYSPAHISAQQVDKVASQIDLAPTLLSILNMSYESSAFGKDILSMNQEDERALVGNYQHLGFYAQGTLSVLSPRQHLSQQRNPENRNPDIITVNKNDPHMLRGIPYYQGADYIYRNGLNTWNHTDDSMSIQAGKN